mgnify:CR=1 FL=1
MKRRTDPTSLALALLAGAATLRACVRSDDARAAALAGAAVFAWMGYDRWHDGLWPFSDGQRQVAGGYP